MTINPKNIIKVKASNKTITVKAKSNVIRAK